MYLANLANLEILKDSLCTDFREAEINACNLDTLEINGYTWIESSISNSNLNAVLFKKCSLDEITFFRSNLEKTTFERCDIFKNTTFSGDTLIKSNWIKCRVSDAVIKNCSMMRCNMDGSVFERTNFIDYEGVYSSIKNTIFKNCIFQVSSDKGMNGFYQAKLENCLFLKCDFIGYPLRETISRNCIFTDCTGHITDELDSNSSIGLDVFTRDAYQPRKALTNEKAALDLIAKCRG